jgi:hypothetical protein
MTDEADTCGATTRDGGSCELRAGWGTDHVGEGRCKLHGGNAGRPPKHGLYSTVARSEIAEKIKVARESDPRDIAAEMAVVRGLLSDYLSGVETVNQDVVSDITTLVAEVRRSADTISQMDARDALTARHVEYLQAAVADVLRTWVPDGDVPDALQDLRSRIESDESALDI